MPKPVLLIVDDNAAFLSSLGRALRQEYKVSTAQSQEEALQKTAPPPDVVLLDLRLNENDLTNREGTVLLQTLHQQFPQLPVLMITAHGDLDTAIECMRLGAVDFIQKPRANLQEIKSRLAQALEHARLSRRVSELERDIQIIEPRQIVGQSPQIEETKRFIEAVAQDGSVTVLIRGETGTGKELVARAIHASGPRQAGPFVPVVLNALPAQIIESELFGYEKGAFTDARERRLGYIEKAHGGVLFLDEIGEMEPGTQVKLLRFLEEREFQRLGSTESVKVDVQIITATNADLTAKIKEGPFREDLYFRLKVHEIVVPPLREHIEDIPLLVAHFLRLFRQQGKKVDSISPEALALLQRYLWPGNIRQLRNTIESAIFRAGIHGHEQIEVKDLAVEVRQIQEDLTDTSPNQHIEDGIDIFAELARTELEYVQRALQAAGGKITGAWKLLGYNDRFALSRRVRRILEKHPEVAEEFPYIIEAFQTNPQGG